MTPALQPLLTADASFPPTGRKRLGAVMARRRRALLQLVHRRGELRISVRNAAGATPGSADVIDLLDALNEGGWLRYGGLHRTTTDLEVIYHPA